MEQIHIGAEGKDNTRVIFPMPMEYKFDGVVNPTHETHKAICIDIETTGFDVDTNDLISLSWVKFEFSGEDYSIHKIISSGTMYNEPSSPISEETEMMTGITQEMVDGHVITNQDVEGLFGDCEFAVAHNAKFDRTFFDKMFDAEIIWACSMADVDWKAKYWLPSLSLAVMLAYLNNWHFEHHNSEADTWASFWLIQREGILEELVKKVFTRSFNLNVKKSSFNDKDRLKQEGAKWNPDAKNWYFAGMTSKDAIEMRDNLQKDVDADYELVEISLLRETHQSVIST